MKENTLAIGLTWAQFKQFNRFLFKALKPLHGLTSCRQFHECCLAHGISSIYEAQKMPLFFISSARLIKHFDRYGVADTKLIEQCCNDFFSHQSDYANLFNSFTYFVSTEQLNKDEKCTSTIISVSIEKNIKKQKTVHSHLLQSRHLLSQFHLTKTYKHLGTQKESRKESIISFERILQRMGRHTRHSCES